MAYADEGVNKHASESGENSRQKDRHSCNNEHRASTPAKKPPHHLKIVRKKTIGLDGVLPHFLRNLLDRQHTLLYDTIPPIWAQPNPQGKLLCTTLMMYSRKDPIILKTTGL